MDLAITARAYVDHHLKRRGGQRLLKAIGASPQWRVGGAAARALGDRDLVAVLRGYATAPAYAPALVDAIAFEVLPFPDPSGLQHAQFP